MSQCVTCQLRLYAELNGQFPPLEGWHAVEPGVHRIGMGLVEMKLANRRS